MTAADNAATVREWLVPTTGSLPAPPHVVDAFERLTVERDELREAAVWPGDVLARLRAAEARAEAAEAEVARLRWAARRMNQALDAYWLGYEGMPKGRYPRGSYDSLDWWNKYEKYRALVEAALAPEQEQKTVHGNPNPFGASRGQEQG